MGPTFMLQAVMNRGYPLPAKNRILIYRLSSPIVVAVQSELL